MILNEEKNGHQVRKTVQTQKNQYSKVDVELFNSTKLNKRLHNESKSSLDWILTHPKSI